MTGPIFAGFGGHWGGEFDAATQQDHRLSEQLVGEFLASTILVIGAPMYNFSISTQLKA